MSAERPVGHHDNWTDNEIRDIRHRYHRQFQSQAAIAKHYGVTQSCVSKLLKRTKNGGAS